MGYACPVCGTPQADARHLANHLAFTAMLHGDDHEAWLDEHVPDWEAAGEAGLADRVSDLADDADYPQVFEDTTGRMAGGHDHDHDNDHAHGADDPPGERSGALFEADAGAGPAVDPAAARARGSGEMDAETREVLAEARDLTREMLAEGADDEERAESDERDGSDATGTDDDADANDADADDADANNRADGA